MFTVLVMFNFNDKDRDLELSRDQEIKKQYIIQNGVWFNRKVYCIRKTYSKVWKGSIDKKILLTLILFDFFKLYINLHIYWC